MATHNLYPFLVFLTQTASSKSLAFSPSIVTNGILVRSNLPFLSSGFISFGILASSFLTL